VPQARSLPCDRRESRRESHRRWSRFFVALRLRMTCATIVSQRIWA